MPCRYYADGEELSISRHVADHLSKLLCEAVSRIEPEVFDTCSAELQAWKRKHDEDDARQTAIEAAEAKRKEEERVAFAERQRVLATLTPEQRKAVGLK